MSNVQPSPNPTPRFRCQALQAPERALLVATTQVFEAYAVPLQAASQGALVAAIFCSLLLGTTNSDAYATLRGRSRLGGFSLRVDQGGNALQITAYSTEGDGNRQDLGSLGTVLQCQGSRLFYRHPAAYLEVLQLITEAASTPGGIYLYTASHGSPKASGSI